MWSHLIDGWTQLKVTRNNRRTFRVTGDYFFVMIVTKMLHTPMITSRSCDTSLNVIQQPPFHM